MLPLSHCSLREQPPKSLASPNPAPPIVSLWGSIFMKPQGGALEQVSTEPLHLA